MDEFLKMDIFFFVTTVATVALALVLFLIALKVWRILGHVERIMAIAAEETELIKEDIDDMRADLRARGFGLMSLGRFISKISRRYAKRSKKAEKEE